MEEFDEKVQQEDQTVFGINDDVKETPEQKKELMSGEWGFRKIFGALAIASLIFTFVLDPDSSPTNSVQLAKNRINYSAPAGQKLFEDETNAGIAAKDFVVSGLVNGGDGGDAKMLIWDFNLEDGDEVQVLVDGKPVHEPFMLTNDPASFSIPAICLVTIKGIRDAGGGISYAVKFPQKKMTIYNVVSVQGINNYKLVAKPI